MVHLTASARRVVARHALWQPEDAVAVALSGGADSVGLLFILRALEAEGECRLTAVLHLNHHVRDGECARDEAFCRALAARLGVPIEVGSVDVPALAAARRWSIEVAGRHARHAFLEQARARVGADVVALAHTAEDQAETVLLRLLRGAGPAGLRGMLPRRGALVRPLLEVRREALRAWLEAMGEPWCEDSTNRDVTNPRNRVRHVLLPLLARDFARGVVPALGRTAEIAREDERLLERLADEAAGAVLRAHEGEVRLDRAALASQPLALQRRLVRRALHAAGHPRAYGARAVARALEACLAAAPALDLPGLRLECRGGEAVLVRANGRRAGARPAPLVASRGSAAWGPLELPVPGAVDLPGGAGRLTAQGPLPREAAPAPGAGVAVVAATAVGARLRVRSRRPGDRLRPLGLGGHRRKLQDVLVDRKVPRDARDGVPVVVDELDRIVWVAGHVTGEEFRAPEGRDAVVVLSVRSA